MRVSDVKAPLLGFVAMGLFWGAWGSLIPEVRAATGASDASLGLALLCVTAGAIPSMIAGGRLVDLLGVRRLLPLSIAAFGLSVIFPAIAPNPLLLGVTLLLLGLCTGFMDIVMNAGIAQSEAATGNRSMQFAHGCFALVYMVSALLSGQVRGAGYGALPILGVVSSICLLLAMLARSRIPHTSKPTEQKGRQPPGFMLIALGIVAAMAFLAENGLQIWSALFLERLLTAPPEISSLAPATVGLAVAVGRFGGQALTTTVSDRAMLVGGSCLGAIGIAIFAMATAIPSALTGIFVGAAGLSVLAPAAFSLAGRSVPVERRGAALATVGVIAYAGFFIGPVMVGFLSESLGLRLATASLAACSCLALIIGLAITSRRASQAEHRAAPPVS